jgi:hypothetical protein
MRKGSVLDAGIFDMLSLALRVDRARPFSLLNLLAQRTAWPQPDHPPAATGMPTTLYASAQPRLALILARVAAPSSRASTTWVQGPAMTAFADEHRVSTSIAEIYPYLL